MGGPRTTSDILGIEIGRDALRGVLLDQAAAELTAASECVLPAHAVNPDGVIDPMVVAPVLETLLTKLNVYDRSRLRVGLSIGPKNSGVGSGAAMASWLDSQAKSLKEPLRCSGGLGVAFVPSRAVDAAVKLASDVGIDLARIDFAPVAAARAIGDQVEDAICVGSGQGWQARMRDFEVLEAMENASVSFDAPLHLSVAGGKIHSMERYGWVEISPELDQAMRVDVGQLAVAVGAAIGVAYQSPADLLAGKTIGCLADKPHVDQSLQHLAGIEVAAGGESTLQLHPRPAAEGSVAQRTPRQNPTTSLSPLRRSERAAAGAGAGAGAAAGNVEPVRAGSGQIAPPRRAAASADAESVAAIDRQTAEAQAAGWDSGLHAADPITMFSPDTEVEEMMGKRNRPLSVDILIGLAILAVIAAAVYFFVL